MRAAVSGMHSDSTEVLTAAEAHEGQGVQMILKDTAEFVEVGEAETLDQRQRRSFGT